MEEEPCRLLGGSFAFFVQFFLASVVFITLYLKWISETPRRAKFVWIYDSLKQGFASTVAHGLNIAMAQMFSSSESNECPWYFMNYSFDVLLGLPLAYFSLKFVEDVLFPDRPKSGDYGRHQNRVDPQIWIFQTCIWVAITLFTKMVVAIPLWVFRAPISAFSDVLFEPLSQSPQLTLLIVMVGWPAICNSWQYYVVDNFLKKSVNVLDEESYLI